MRSLLPIILLCLSGSLSAKERLVLLADGLNKEDVSTQVQSALNLIEGAKVLQITPKSITIEFDPAKVTEASLKKTFTASGLTITGQKAFFKIKGLVCSSCSNILTSLLAKEKGVIYVNSISHLNGKADISFDPEETSQAKIEAAVNKTRYQVLKPLPPKSQS